MQKGNKNIILSSENLRIGYPKLVVAENISLAVEEAKLISILGLNGAGKSTLIKTLARIQEPLNGTIFLRNKNINQYKQSSLAQEMAIVLTEKLPDNLLSVYELIAMGRYTYTNWLDQLTKNDKEKIDFAIEATKTSSLLSKKFSELSDGQRQKVLIAKTIAQDTPLILLDEPTAHLDVHHRMETFLLLKELAHKFQKTIIMATHEVGLSTQLADELWLVHNQKLQIGSPKALINNNSLGTIFDSDLIRFNAKTTTFEFK